MLRVGVKQDAPPCGFLALDDAAGWRVAVLRGSVQERDVPELQPRAILVPVESLGEVVEQSPTGASGFIVRFTSMAPAAKTWLRDRAR